jgi:hypothetical protein
LNGWQKPSPDGEIRTGYSRARWFLTRPDDVHSLRFRVRGLGSTTNGAEFQVYLGGTLALTTALEGSWSDVAASLDSLRPRSRFMCELRAVHDKPEAVSFDDYRFAIRDRHFV